MFSFLEKWQSEAGMGSAASGLGPGPATTKQGEKGRVSHRLVTATPGLQEGKLLSA